MQKRKIIKADLLDNAKAALTAASKAEKKELTKKSAIEALKPQIRAARARGMTWSEIKAALAGAGVDISVPTLSAEAGSSMRAEPKLKTPKAPAAPVPPVASASVAPQGMPARLPAGHFEIKKDRLSEL